MANILYRASLTPTVPATTSVKNSPLTNLEVDANFKSINNDILTRAAAGANLDILSIGGLTTALTVAQGGTGVKTLTGIVKAAGAANFVAATPGADYAPGTNGLTTGIIKSTTGTGAFTIAVAADFPTLNQSTTGNAATATNVAYTGLTGTVPTWNQSTTGNAATATNVAYTGLTGTVPTWNQSTTGNAATVTNGVYTTGAQTIAGVKNFSNTVMISSGTAAVPSLTFIADGANDTGWYWISDGVIGISLNGAYAGKYAVGGHLTMVGSVTAPIFYGALTGNATTASTATSASTANAASNSIFATQATGSEGQLIARFSGQNDAYLYNNASSWGLFSGSGGSIISYNRSTGVATVTANCTGNAGTATLANGLNAAGGYTMAGLTIQSTANYITFNDTDWGMRYIHNNGGQLGFLNSSGNWSFMHDDAGSGYFTGNVVAYWSDRRLKENIRNKESVGNIIDAFRVVEYDWNKDALDYYRVGIEAKKNQTGLIAQEAQAVFPNAVVVNKTAELSKMQIERGEVSRIPVDEPLLTIDWDVITPLLLKEAQDSRKRTLKLEKLVEELQKEIEILKAA